MGLGSIGPGRYRDGFGCKIDARSSDDGYIWGIVDWCNSFTINLGRRKRFSRREKDIGAKSRGPIARIYSVMIGYQRIPSVKVKDLNTLSRPLVLKLFWRNLVCWTGILKSWVNWYACTWFGLPVMAL